MNSARTAAAVVLAAACLTTPAAPADAARADPTGRIVFTVLEPSFTVTKSDIGIIGVDGMHQQKLTNEDGFDVSAAWSPDGRRIAFTSSRSMPPGFAGEPRFYSELYVMNADGSNVQRITFTEGVTDFQPAWSPDGRRIVVSRAAGITPPPGFPTVEADLVIVDVATGHEQQITSRPDTWEWYAHWSPDGKRIAFEGDLLEPGNDDVYTIKADGTGLQRLTTRPGFDGDVRYSPDGTQLVFDSDRAGGSDLFLMRANGTNVRQLTTDHNSYSASFSPDGQSVAFAQDVNGVADLFRMRLDGTQLTNLTRSPSSFEFDAEWSPN